MQPFHTDSLQKTSGRRRQSLLQSGPALAGLLLLLGLSLFKPSSMWANSQDGTVTIPDDVIRKSIVLVKVSTIQYDYTRPWIRLPGQSFTVAGLVVPGNRI